MLLAGHRPVDGKASEAQAVLDVIEEIMSRPEHAWKKG